MNVPKYTYKTHYYCSRGCGPDKGWIKHGQEKLAKNGCKICPICGRDLRLKSRWAFGAHRKEEPMRVS